MTVAALPTPLYAFPHMSGLVAMRAALCIYKGGCFCLFLVWVCERECSYSYLSVVARHISLSLSATLDSTRQSHQGVNGDAFFVEVFSHTNAPMHTPRTTRVRAFILTAVCEVELTKGVHSTGPCEAGSQIFFLWVSVLLFGGGGGCCFSVPRSFQFVALTGFSFFFLRYPFFSSSSVIRSCTSTDFVSYHTHTHTHCVFLSFLKEKKSNKHRRVSLSLSILARKKTKNTHAQRHTHTHKRGGDGGQQQRASTRTTKVIQCKRWRTMVKRSTVAVECHGEA